MQSAAPSLRTHFDDAPDFHTLLAEQLRRAPWFLASFVIHAIAVLLLVLLIPADRPPAQNIVLGVQPPAPEVLPPVEPPKPPEVKPVEPVEPTIEDRTVEPTPTEAPADAFESSVSGAFDHPDGWNPAVGLGPGGAKGDGIYSKRVGGDGRRGGPGSGSVPPGLQWLAAHQDEDGRWDCDHFMKHDQGEPCDGAGNAVHDVGVTGLCLLAFLGEGSTLRSGLYSDQIRDGVRWLKQQQQPNGLFGGTASHDFVYDHAIAAYAMCEAYGLSNYVTLRDCAQHGLDYLAQHRNPYGVWRYQPRDGDGDSSVTGWCIMALESGRNFGLNVDQDALRCAAVFLDGVTDPTGKCGYTRRGEASSRHPGDHGTRFPIDKGEALTAVGLFCRFFLGQDPKETPVMQAAADLILRKPPVWDEKGGSIDQYYWYYGTYALYQMGGTHWKQWSKQLTPAVVKSQRQDGNYLGSWDPAGVWGEDGGRVYSTALMVLTLQAYYRYSRLVR